MIVVNKWWECDPVLFAMLSDNARPPASPWPAVLQPPRPRPNPAQLPPENKNPSPRAVFTYRTFKAEVWCISDLLEHLDPALQSSSEQKAKYLPRIFSYGASPDLVFAVGTAEFPEAAVSENGNVVIGSKVFMVDGHPEGSNPLSKWTDGPFEQVIDSSLPRAFFSQLVAFDVPAAANRFLAVPLAPASAAWVVADYINVALGAVNVTDYSEYGIIDPLTAKIFWSKPRDGKAGSIETTHGIIRVQCESPFLFVSGIVDRFGYFDQDVNPRSHAQNTAAAHNAGVVVSWLLMRLDQLW
ncbi:MAG TPA: hypothetical protein VMS96_03895 [Terriglobales bacterium]|nr:hypothetical protein [Terriglobales bacterium]